MNKINQVYQKIFNEILSEADKEIREIAVSLFFGNVPKASIPELKEKYYEKVKEELKIIIPNKRSLNKKTKELVDEYFDKVIAEFQKEEPNA